MAKYKVYGLVDGYRLGLNGWVPETSACNRKVLEVSDSFTLSPGIWYAQSRLFSRCLLILKSGACRWYVAPRDP